MQLIRDISTPAGELLGGAVSIGNFDGVHQGHARLVERLRARAAQADGPAVVFTFDPHPAQLLRPEAAPPALCSTERKAELLGRLGVDAVVAYPTDRALLEMEAVEFFETIVRGRLGARAVVEGPNFLFGHNRGGDVRLLEQLCRDAGILLEVVEPIDIDGQTISSSLVRDLLRRGDVDRARALLTEPHRIRGRVVHGAGRGADLGYPTANLEEISVLVPAEAIYAGRAWAPGRREPFPAAISVGGNPTFGESTLKVEPYLIGFDGSLYNQTIEVDFLSRLREIVRFDSVDALVAQMNRDVEATRRIAQQCEEPR